MAVVCVASATLARADESDGQLAAGEKPWARGVSAERRAEALRRFQEGNAHFEQSQYPAALETYRVALASWDHPAIHYNVAVCLIHLDRPLEAFQHLSAAMQHGPEPLGADIYGQAETHRKLLLGQLAPLEVTCDTDGAAVSLDGRPLLSCPGKTSLMLTAGIHQLVATRAGYLTQTRQVTLLPGKPSVERFALVSITHSVTYQRRWRSWKPWAVVGGGAAVALLGLPFRAYARSTMDQFEEEFADECPTGCPRSSVSPEVDRLERKARTWDGVAVGMFATGAATIVTGTVLLYLNRERPVAVTERLSIGPMSAAGGTGVSVGVRY